MSHHLLTSCLYYSIYQSARITTIYIHVRTQICTHAHDAHTMHSCTHTHHTHTQHTHMHSHTTHEHMHTHTHMHTRRTHAHAHAHIHNTCTHTCTRRTHTHTQQAIENSRNLVALSCSIKLVNAIVASEKRETPITDVS